MKDIHSQFPPLQSCAAFSKQGVRLQQQAITVRDVGMYYNIAISLMTLVSLAMNDSM